MITAQQARDMSIQVTTKESQEKIINNFETKRGNRYICVFWNEKLRKGMSIGFVLDAKAWGNGYNPTADSAGGHLCYYYGEFSHAWYKIT